MKKEKTKFQSDIKSFLEVCTVLTSSNPVVLLKKNYDDTFPSDDEKDTTTLFDFWSESCKYSKCLPDVNLEKNEIYRFFLVDSDNKISQHYAADGNGFLNFIRTEEFIDILNGVPVFRSK